MSKYSELLYKIDELNDALIGRDLDIERLARQRTKLREQVAMLRDALIHLSSGVAKDDDAWLTSYEYVLAQKALSATEPKP